MEIYESLIFIRIILIIFAVAATVYRITIWADQYENYLIAKAQKLKTLIVKWDGEPPSHAEEVKSIAEFTVYKRVQPKYFKSSSTTTYDRVAHKCPNCGNYLPILSWKEKITCPNCELIIGTTKLSYEMWVWRNS